LHIIFLLNINIGFKRNIMKKFIMFFDRKLIEIIERLDFSRLLTYENQKEAAFTNILVSPIMMVLFCFWHIKRKLILILIG
jgi:hypothetical protein